MCSSPQKVETAIAVSFVHRLFAVELDRMGAQLTGLVWRALKHLSEKKESMHQAELTLQPHQPDDCAQVSYGMGDATREGRGLSTDVIIPFPPKIYVHHI